MHFKKHLFGKVLVLSLLASSLFFQSCKSIREIALFQSTDSTAYLQLPRLQPEVAKIQPNDILAISVTSMDKNTNEILNFANVNPIPNAVFPGLNNQGPQRGQPLGYMVDTDGNVEVPFIGKVWVNELTLSQAADVIRQKVDSTLVADPAVNVRFLNRKYSVMGEVGRPGMFNLLDDRTTLPEVLAMAGDIGVYGDRENVLLVRELPTGQEMVKLNLTDQSIFTSPYYYVKNGDVIYVQPLKEKATTTDRRVQLAPIVLSALSTTIVILTFVINAFK
jgi:polysaccharide export outer membrane protein